MSSTIPATQSSISQDQIAQRAYELWQTRGSPEGDGGSDWQEAENQLIEESRQRGRRLLPRLFGRWRKKRVA